MARPARLSALTVLATTAAALHAVAAQAVDVAPRAVAMQGCAGSTFVTGTLRRLVANVTRVAVGMHEFELLRKEKNPLYTPERGEAGAFLAMYERQKARGRALVFKADIRELHSEAMARAFQAVRARVVHVYRANALDKAVCNIVDCFVSMTGHGVGVPVYRNGSAAPACFLRRPKFGAPPPPAFARINVSAIVPHLAKLHRLARTRRLKLAARGYAMPPFDVTTEALAEFTHDPGALMASAVAYKRVLTAWGLPARLEDIAATLRPLSGTRPPPPPHYRKIYNYAKVHRALMAAGVPPELRAMLRTRPHTTTRHR